MENELSKGFAGVEINGVRFSNISEMLQYMDKQREQIEKAKDLLEWWVNHCGYYDLHHAKKTEQFIREIEE